MKTALGLFFLLAGSVIGSIGLYAPTVATPEVEAIVRIHLELIGIACLLLGTILTLKKN